jgi:hypothetical protein
VIALNIPSRKETHNVGKLNKRVVMAYEPDPISIGGEAEAKKLARAINDLVKVVVWDENNDAHVVLRDHLKKMSKDLRSGPDEVTSKPIATKKAPAKKSPGKRRGRPPLSDEEKARRKAEREAKMNDSSGSEEAPKRRRGRPPGSKNKKTSEKSSKDDSEGKARGSSAEAAPGPADEENSIDIPMEVGADAIASSDAEDASPEGLFD